MSVLKVIELLSVQKWRCSSKAITKTSKSVKIYDRYVKDQSAAVSDGKISEYRVTLNLTFELE
jgi:flavin-binding protein dodecin